MVAYLISLSCFVVVLADDGAVFLLVLFRTGGKTPDPKLQVRSYMDVMREQNLSKEEVRSHPVHSNLTGMQKFYSILFHGNQLQYVGVDWSFPSPKVGPQREASMIVVDNCILGL